MPVPRFDQIPGTMARSNRTQFALSADCLAKAEARPARDARDLRWSGLMVEAQTGDDLAYARLLREYLPWLRMVCGRRLWDREEVEDAVQDTLLTLRRIRDTYDASRPFRP